LTLVDTTVWIDYFGSGEGPHAEALQRLIDEDEDVRLTGLVLTEVLQGIRKDSVLREVAARLAEFDLLEPEPEDYLEAAQVYRRCRRHGITPRSTVDCLLAALCLRRGAALLHRDRDFDHMAEVVALEVVAAVSGSA